MAEAIRKMRSHRLPVIPSVNGSTTMTMAATTFVKERIVLDKVDPNTLLNEITTIDNALTRPWTVTRKYQRERNPHWIEHACTENNTYVFTGTESYFIGADGLLMPTKKDQPPPDLRHFSQRQKK